MTLEEIKETIRTISVSHKQISSFDLGEEFLVATGKDVGYPMCFLEIPYSTTYDLPSHKWKTHQFALLILIEPSADIIGDDHMSISKAETIGDAIIGKLETDLPFILDLVSGNSLRNFSDDNLSGYRFDLVVKTNRECANPSNFN